MMPRQRHLARDRIVREPRPPVVLGSGWRHAVLGAGADCHRRQVERDHRRAEAAHAERAVRGPCPPRDFRRDVPLFGTAPRQNRQRHTASRTGRVTGAATGGGERGRYRPAAPIRLPNASPPISRGRLLKAGSLRPSWEASPQLPLNNRRRSFLGPADQCQECLSLFQRQAGSIEAGRGRSFSECHRRQSWVQKRCRANGRRELFIRHQIPVGQRVTAHAGQHHVQRRGGTADCSPAPCSDFATSIAVGARFIPVRLTGGNCRSAARLRRFTEPRSQASMRPSAAKMV